MRDTIISYLRVTPAASAGMMADDLGLPRRDLQAALIALDDSGHVLMRHGIYRLSEAAKKGLLE